MPEQLDTSPIWLTLHLAVVSTLCLLALSIPIAWWLAKTSNPLRPWISAVVTLPLVLPPTVLGFYLLIFLSPNGWGGNLTQWLGLGTLPFTFTGLVIASIIHSLPFAVQPLTNAFRQMGDRPLEVAATLGASPWDRWVSVVLPLARPGLLTALTLSFAHVVGEFGVILMIGGNIPGETKVLSVAIYEHVESQEYRQAHILAAGTLMFCFAVLLYMHCQQRNERSSLVSS